MRGRLAAALSLGTALSLGCATYVPEALPAVPGAAATLDAVPGPSTATLAGLTVSSSAAQALGESDAMALAVANDPDLEAARLKSGIARAQLFEAGLLPDPTLHAGVSRGPEFTGYDAGVSEDLRAWALRGAAVGAARARTRQVDLAVLWRETGTAVAAGELFIRLREDADLAEALGRSRKLLADRYAVDQADFQQSGEALQKVAADLAVLSDADAALRRVELDADAARHRLDFMLGLEPTARPALAGPSAPAEPAPPGLTEDAFQAALAAMPQRRADLLALKAGYASQEERLREAVEAQFPALSLGVTRSRGAEEGVDSTGVSLDLGLPILDGGRGRVKVERATRAALRADYRARLDAARSDADRLWRAEGIMTGQLARLEEQTKALRALARTAEEHFRSGAMSAGAYVGLESSLLGDEEEAIRLRAALARTRLELRALLGRPLAGPSL